MFGAGMSSSSSENVKSAPIGGDDLKGANKSDVTIAVGSGNGDVKSSQVVSQPDRKMAKEWSVQEVVSFIRSLNPAFGEYAKVFEKDSVDGSMLLHDIDSEWIAAAIPNPLHRRRIARELLELQNVPPLPLERKARVFDASTAVKVSEKGVVQTEMLGNRNQLVKAAVYNQIFPGSNKEIDSNIYFVLKSTGWDFESLDGLNDVSDDVARTPTQDHMFDDLELKSKWKCQVRKEHTPNGKLVCNVRTNTCFWCVFVMRPNRSLLFAGVCDSRLRSCHLHPRQTLWSARSRILVAAATGCSQIGSKRSMRQ